MRLQTLCVLAIAVIGIAVATTAQADYLPANVVNIDFNGYRGSESLGLTYSGAMVAFGPAGSGTTWNGITIDSVHYGDNQTVGGSPLRNSANGASSVVVTVAGVGGDNQGAGSVPTAIAALVSDYTFGTTSITISGLGSATAADIYFYIRNGSTAPILGGVTATDLGNIVNAVGGGNWDTYRAHVVATNGTITTTTPTWYVLSGMSIATVPEPGMLALLSVGLVSLLAYAWRKRK